MKILFFHYLLLEAGGGTAAFMMQTATELRKRYPKLEIGIITLDETLLRKIVALYSLYFFGRQDKTLFHESTQAIKKKLGSVPYYRAKRFSDITAIANTYDRIYSSNNLLEMFILSTIIGYRHLPPVIYGCHIPLQYPQPKTLQDHLHNLLYRSTWYTHALSGAKKIHVINQFGYQRLRTFLPKQTICLIYNPFDHAQFRKQQEKKLHKVSFPRHSTKVIWVGRLTHQKGVERLLSLINQLNSEGYASQFFWTIIGDGEMREQIEKLTKTWNNICYLGYLPHHDIAHIYAQHDIYLSTSSWEGFPYTLLEAQSTGLPILAYNIPGCTDIITQGKNGYLVDSEQAYKKQLLCFRTHSFTKQSIQKLMQKKWQINKQYQSLYQLLTYD